MSNDRESVDGDVEVVMSVDRSHVDDRCTATRALIGVIGSVYYIRETIWMAVVIIVIVVVSAIVVVIAVTVVIAVVSAAAAA